MARPAPGRPLARLQPLRPRLPRRPLPVARPPARARPRQRDAGRHLAPHALRRREPAAARRAGGRAHDRRRPARRGRVAHRAAPLHAPAGPAHAHAAPPPGEQRLHAARHRGAPPADPAHRRRVPRARGGARRDGRDRRPGPPRARDRHLRDAGRPGRGPGPLHGVDREGDARPRPLPSGPRGRRSSSTPRCGACSRRRPATRPSSPSRRASTSRGGRTPTSPSGAGRTSAWARISPSSRARSRSRAWSCASRTCVSSRRRSSGVPRSSACRGSCRSPSARIDRRMPDALFERDGARFVPTELCRGPWSPEAQHGGPPAALMARAAEHFEGGEEMAVARLTVELLRPVPLVPLTVAARWARPGRKVQIVEASLRAGDSEVARALGLRLRRVPLALPPGAERGPSPPPGPGRGTETLPPWGDGILRPAFHADAVEHRFVAGGFDRPGPATDWIRLRVPLVAGEPTSPLCRVAAAADFGNGVSWVLSRLEGYTFINPDLTIYLHRMPAGEWVCLEAATWPSRDGIGFCESRLWDERGLIGRALQSLLLGHQ